MPDLNIEGFQLSPQQRHLWKIGAQPSDAASPYVAHAAVRIRGDVNLVTLKAVLDELPVRHEILRTSFYAPPEISTPLQVIADEPPTRPAALLNLTSSSGRDHLLTIELPVLLCDAGGLRALVADIAREYDARVGGTTMLYEGLQYADASIWLNDTLESPEAAAGRSFWESRDFAGLLASRLPFERAKAGNPPFAPRSVLINLAPESLAAARTLIAASDTSMETFLLACWQCLLQRLLDSDAIAIGYMADGRSYAELKNAVGLFARCLPLSGELSREMSFGDALSRIGQLVRQAKQWAECFDWRAVPHDPNGREPFVPLVFEYQATADHFAANGVIFNIDSTSDCADRYKLKLTCGATPEAFGRARLDYDEAAFERADIERLARQFETLFAAAVRSPQSAIDALPMLPATEKEEIIEALGRHARPGGDLIHRQFEEQAARVPGEPAVIFETASLTYQELNRRSNQIAHYLKQLSVGPDVVVGLCMDRSVDIAVGILGILKAGAAYLPLDPQLPAARLAMMLEASRATLVISRSAFVGLLPTQVRAVLVDRDREIDQFPVTNPEHHVQPAHLAYVLFTSGSTGTPKGVAVEHQQLASYVDAVSRRLDLPAGATFATVTTFAADLGNTSIFPALASGGSLHFISEERATDANAFAEYVRRRPIDVLKIVPSHLKALLTCARPADVLPRQRLVLGGEACPWDLVDDVRRLAPSCVIFNHYGPTETTVGATIYRVPEDGSRLPASTVPIGRPLDHAQVYVLDRHLHMVPTWATGELHIGGAGVARGYLTDAELTAARFIHDPWSTESEGRMYKTGDRVRILPGGVLEFLGRIDNQVKIRGYRIELGEIDTALRRHASVRSAEVLVHEDSTGPRLAAFLVLRPGERAEASELREFLRQQGLPDYMIPASFAALDALPLTANGKLDRRALHEWLERPPAVHVQEEPLTEWEAVVAGIWQELLGVDEIQASDNFYDLGGHSLMAIQVVSALERKARVQVSPRDLVFHTLKQFAALCAAKSLTEGDPQPSPTQG